MRRRSSGLGSTAHLDQMGVVRMTARDASRLGPGRHDALLRSLRITAQGLQHSALSGESELQRRAAPLRSGGALVGQDSPARQRAVERADQGMGRSPLRHRSDDDHLFGKPRRDAHAQRRLARQVHAALTVGLLHAEPPGARVVLVRLDDGRRSGVAQLLSRVDVVLERLQKRRRPRDHRLGFRIHLSDLRLRLYQRVRDAAGGRFPSARSDSIGDAVRRRGAA